jgi:DNA repair protein RecN (Recombination protein N)
MLQELRVENLLLIEQAQLRLSAGLNVLTGETGAGKTVLAHALDLLLGGRARAGIVRPGAGEAYVEGVFDLPAALAGELGERLPADATEVVIARRVGADGRTRAYVNGRSAALGDVRELAGALLTFYGQHEHRKLTLAACQLEILDAMCGPDHGERLAACAGAHADLRRAERELAELRELAGARERELDLLAFELEEIDAAAPSEEEHLRLVAVRERLRRLDALRDGAAAAAEALSPEDAAGTARGPGAAAATLAPLAGVDAALDALAERLGALAIESQEAAAELRAYAEGAAGLALEDLPASVRDGDATLDGLEARIEVVERLARKHGGSIAAVLAHAEQARARHDQLANAELALAETGTRADRAREQLEEYVRTLRAARRKAAQQLKRAVGEQLGALGMAEASFEVLLEERSPGPAGGDAAEFAIAPNPGVPAGPVREIASGGELSRVMLAIMGAASAKAPEVTLVFDEIDAGVGGHAARAVGAKLRELAQHRQVICITHLPQIASLGDRHFTIAKDTSALPTRATVAQLGERDVVGELVRMLGADAEDQGARRHARELRRAA